MNQSKKNVVKTLLKQAKYQQDNSAEESAKKSKDLRGLEPTVDCQGPYLLGYEDCYNDDKRRDIGNATVPTKCIDNSKYSQDKYSQGCGNAIKDANASCDKMTYSAYVRGINDNECFNSGMKLKGQFALNITSINNTTIPQFCQTRVNRQALDGCSRAHNNGVTTALFSIGVATLVLVALATKLARCNRGNGGRNDEIELPGVPVIGQAR